MSVNTVKFEDVVHNERVVAIRVTLYMGRLAVLAWSVSIKPGPNQAMRRQVIKDFLRSEWRRGVGGFELAKHYYIV